MINLMALHWGLINIKIKVDGIAPAACPVVECAVNKAPVGRVGRCRSSKVMRGIGGNG